MTIAPARLMADLDDRYQLLEVIGRGGMATVYRAHDVKHDRTVALKVLHDDLAASLGPERFKREILIAGRLQHPHILSVFDSGDSSGRLWFTMPYVQGESLRDRLRRVGKLPVETALMIVREAAQALAYAHKQGVIHRDIKPENILITEDGSTLVADFGIARAIGDRTFETGLSQSLTQTGSAIGTPTYMAPEQATGETVLDERVDQYALAAVLYEMLTGAPPFTGANAAALIAARFSTQITPMRTSRAEVPADVDGAVLRALALKPFDRFPTIADFARAVAPAMATPSQFETQPRPMLRAPQRRLWLVGAGVLGVVALCGAALWRRSATAAAAPEGPIRIAVLPLQNLGDSAEAYFADGLSDELRASLVSLPGLQVIARASSVQFAETDKTPAQIAEELGVRYLLTGTLRYEHRADGSAVVRVRPELMEVSGTGPATTRWQASFDEALTNAPALQTKIATQVATQLQLTLGAADRTRLARTPTTIPEAYDAYLRGTSSNDVTAAGLRRRAADLERATTLDPNFGMAWTALAGMRGQLYVNVSSTPEFARLAKEAAEQARAVAPGELADHQAWLLYHVYVTNDLAKAEREARAALRASPNDAALMARLASVISRQGRPDEARPLFEMATQLDPLNRIVWSNYGMNLLEQRRYAEARSPLERAALLGPTSQNAVLSQVMLYAGMGDLDRARDVIREAYRRFPPEELDPFLSIYRDYGWILDSAAQQRVLAAPLAAFDNERGTQAFVRAQIYAARGDQRASRQAATDALPALAAEAAKQPDDPQWPFLRGVAAALAGQPAEAERLIREGQAVERRVNVSPTNASYHGELRARIYTLNGQYEQAFDELEAVLAKPGQFGRGNLALDPTFTPLRTLPRYQRIMTIVSEQERR